MDHTLREMREHHPAEGLNLPFEETDAINFQLGDMGRMAGAVTVRSAAVEAVTGKYPVLAFTFMAPDGLNVAAQVVLVLDGNGMLDFDRLVHQAVKSAVKASQ
jgi:hypothetical protein